MRTANQQKQTSDDVSFFSISCEQKQLLYSVGARTSYVECLLDIVYSLLYYTYYIITICRGAAGGARRGTQSVSLNIGIHSYATHAIDDLNILWTVRCSPPSASRRLVTRPPPSLGWRSAAVRAYTTATCGF
jgi:hypothetical protein